jgi:hypothetical protein
MHISQIAANESPERTLYRYSFLSHARHGEHLEVRWVASKSKRRKSVRSLCGAYLVARIQRIAKLAFGCIHSAIRNRLERIRARARSAPGTVVLGRRMVTGRTRKHRIHRKGTLLGGWWFLIISFWD